jgi:hypothetical protein
VVVSVEGILHRRLVTGEAPPFIDLLVPLASLALEPYLDAQAMAQALEQAELLACALAEERSSRPPRRAAGVPIPKALSNPRAHRSRQCLLYLANHSGASNRAVAEGIGIAHLRQVSDLLARLAGQDLLVKRTGRPGHPNAWSLTPQGELIARALLER